jgi:hypothetical protein
MTIRYVAICGGAALVAMTTLTNSAQALSRHECSVKYQAAKKAGTLANMKWNDFRKAECGATASAVPAPVAQSKTRTRSATTGATASGRGATGDTMFPRAISTKYSSESPGKARMHTCLDQYRANKTSDANGGLKWIARGGGYYSECNRRLKAQA